MTLPVLPELGYATPLPRTTKEKPQETPATCMQEQFTGQMPVRSERPMSEILAERLAEANPTSPNPVFIP